MAQTLILFPLLSPKGFIVMKFDQMSLLNLDTCEYGKAITVQMNPIPSEVYSRFFKLMFCSCHLKPQKM